MEFLYGLISKLKENYIFILLCILLIVINDAIILGDFYSLKKDKELKIDNISTKVEENKTNNICVDVKGKVKKPGVYQVNESMTVNDVINLAGGLKKGASTKNINLSKKVKDEMVIIIYSTSDIKKHNTYIKINNDAIVTMNDEPLLENTSSDLIVTNDPVIQNDKLSSLININTATLDTLMTLPGIGESKAKAIIEYRDKQKFSLKEDIKNVSGIGDAAFEKIKDYITV